MDERTKKILSRLEAQCSRREYCRSEIYAKALKALKQDADAADEVTESLLKDRFVDDLRYASAFAREKSSLGGWGRLKIRMALSAKKIDSPTIDLALQEIDTDREDDKLLHLLQTKRKSLEGDPYIKLKLIKYALGRGYDYDKVSKAVNEALL